MDIEYKKYDKYKDSGVDWLGEIPEHWELVPLKRVLRFQTGGTPYTGESSGYDGDLPWVTISDLCGKYTNKYHRISSSGVKKANIPLTCKGSLLYSFKLSVGQVSFASKDLYTNEAIASFFKDEKIDLRYFYYSLPITIIKNAATNIYGAYILNQNLINNSKVIEIPFPEQTAIANFLDEKCEKIDRAISQKEKLIELLKERKQILIQNAVTKGIDPNVKMKDSGVDWLGEIPEHWEVKKLKYVLDERNERTKTGEEPLFMVSQVHGLVVRSEYHEKAQVAQSNIDNKIVYENDLVFNKLKAHLGVFFKSCISFKGIVSPDYAVYKSKGVIKDLKLLELLFRHPSYIGQFITRATGIVEGLIRLYTADLFDIEIPISPEEEQIKILDFISLNSNKYEKSILQQQNQIDKLKEYKSTLIDSAVTGKIKVV